MRDRVPESERKPGQPGQMPKDIKNEEVFKLAQFNCTQKEIGDFFGVDERYIREKFHDEYERGRANIRISLRRKQIDKALTGDTTMLIWLGKNMLGQKDRSEMSGDPKNPVRVEQIVSPEERAARLKKVLAVLSAADGKVSIGIEKDDGGAKITVST